MVSGSSRGADDVDGDDFGGAEEAAGDDCGGAERADGDDCGGAERVPGGRASDGKPPGGATDDMMWMFSTEDMGIADAECLWWKTSIRVCRTVYE